MPIKTKKTQTKTTRLNRPSEIRITGVPPIMHIYIKKKRQTRSPEIRLSGVPPIMPIKPQKPKKHTKGKIDPQKYVLQGSPL